MASCSAARAARSPAAPGVMEAVEARGIAEDMPGEGAWKGAAVLAAVLAILATALGAGFWRWKGAEGLLASLAGFLAGGGIAAVSTLLRRRAAHETGPRIVTAMVGSTFASF